MNRYYGQSRSHSAMESAVSVAVGFLVSYTANMIVLPQFGFNVSAIDGLAIAVIFTFISLIRSYFIRRFFNYLHMRDIL